MKVVKLVRILSYKPTDAFKFGEVNFLISVLRSLIFNVITIG